MLLRSSVVFALLAAVALAPAAMAGSQPAAYYLKDDGLPVQDGVLNATRANATQPSLRMIPAALTDIAPVQFLTTNGTKHLDRIWGPLYVALWLGPSPTYKGNLTVSLQVHNATGPAWTIGRASVRLDVNTSKAPQPTALVPPTPTPGQDPQAYATEVALFEVYQLLPVVAPPPTLLYLGFVNLKVNATAQLGLTFALAPGDSALPLPEGPGATIEYNASTSPSLLYVPWYKFTPYPTYTYHYTYTPRSYSRTYEPTWSTSDSEPPAKPKTGGHGFLPAPELSAGLAVVAVVLAVVRRRTR